MSSHWELCLGRCGRGQELHRIYSSLTSTTSLVLFSDPQHQVFWQDTFGRTPQAGHTSEDMSLQCWQAVIFYFGALSCSCAWQPFPAHHSLTQTTNGMIGLSVYLSIFYYSCHFRALQVINSPYLFICFPSKIFPFHLKPLFVVQAAANLIRLNRAAEQLWRGLKISEHSKAKPWEMGLLPSSLPWPQGATPPSPVASELPTPQWQGSSPSDLSVSPTPCQPRHTDSSQHHPEPKYFDLIKQTPQLFRLWLSRLTMEVSFSTSLFILISAIMQLG